MVFCSECYASTRSKEQVLVGNRLMQFVLGDVCSISLPSLY